MMMKKMIIVSLFLLLAFSTIGCLKPAVYSVTDLNSRNVYTIGQNGNFCQVGAGKLIIFYGGIGYSVYPVSVGDKVVVLDSWEMERVK